MTESNTQRTFVKPDDTATITCPECHLIKTIPVGQFRGNRHAISVRCACGYSFPVNLDFRRHYRKKTTLPGVYDTETSGIDNKKWKKTRLTGTYTIEAPASGNGHMQVTNISLGGLQFITSDNHAIETGQKARVAFTLDDRHQTELTKNVIIQSVNGHVIGCRFAEGEPLEQALRFYLFP
jgi:hypothetical protein